MQRQIDLAGCIACMSVVLALFLVFTGIDKAYGSQENNRWGASLYQDAKASNIGDLVTIFIIEDSKAEQNVATQRGKEAGAGVNVTGKLGSSRLLGRVSPFTAGGNSDYTSDLSTSRTTEVKATVTALVTNIYPNGNLFIEGTKNAEVNGERLEVTVTGIVRPSDIRAGNVITSDKIANSNIVYKGTKKKGFWRTVGAIATFPFRLFEPLF